MGVRYKRENLGEHHSQSGLVQRELFDVRTVEIGRSHRHNYKQQHKQEGGQNGRDFRTFPAIRLLEYRSGVLFRHSGMAYC